jgi:hypothetical protein
MENFVTNDNQSSAFQKIISERFCKFILKALKITKNSQNFKVFAGWLTIFLSEVLTHDS